MTTGSHTPVLRRTRTSIGPRPCNQPLPDETVKEAGRLRSEGVSFPNIAKALGLGSRSAAHAAVQRAVNHKWIERSALPKVPVRAATSTPLSAATKPPLFVAPKGEREDWRDQAACLGDPDPDVFYRPGAGDVALAKSICARCPVMAECLTNARASRDEWAVRGGLTAAERGTPARRFRGAA
jgi:WhiB family redox-sensing transcriptional regulator